MESKNKNKKGKEGKGQIEKKKNDSESKVIIAFATSLKCLYSSKMSEELLEV